MINHENRYSNIIFICIVKYGYVEAKDNNTVFSIQEQDGTLSYGSGLNEFLTFGTEQVFKILNNSKGDVDTFRNEYAEQIQNRVNSIRVEYKTVPPQVDTQLQYAAIGLIRGVMEPHLRFLESKNANLQPYMNAANVVLTQEEERLFKSVIEVTLTEYSDPKLTPMEAAAVRKMIDLSKATDTEIMIPPSNTNSIWYKVENDKLVFKSGGGITTDKHMPEIPVPPAGKGINMALNLRRTEKESLTELIFNKEAVDAPKYNLTDRLALTNGNNNDLLNKIDKAAIVKASIDIKSIDGMDTVDKSKAGSVRILAEHNHINEHESNVGLLIADIESGKIDKNTVIAIERKQYGDNLGMKDVIKLAAIMEYNEKNPDNQLLIPEEIRQSPIYQDATLYKIAKVHNVKVIGLEGKDLEHGKESEHYNENREQYMINMVHEVRRKGYNVIAYVGADHKKVL